MRRWLLAGIIVVLLHVTAAAGVVTGRVSNKNTGEPIDRATIRVEGTGRSTLTNENGQYRLWLEPGSYRLKFSHIAHYSEYIEVEMPVSDSTLTRDIILRQSTLILRPLKVYDRRYDPAQKIIAEAIRHKEEILSKIKDYTFDAYTRLVVRDVDKPDSTAIRMIAESQLEYKWEQPDKYKETIIARRQTANLKPDQNLISVGEVLNLNLNRIDIGQYAVVSPTARDALDYYNYYLLDTLFIDSQAVFRLEIEPKSQTTPLFVGTIDIADSTYNVVGVDIGFNDAINLPFLDSLRYAQVFAEFEGGYWMPVQEKLVGIVDINLPVLPVMKIDYVASMHNYSFNTGHPEKTFKKYLIEVDEAADDQDSLTWLTGQVVPLTMTEQEAYHRIDSTKKAPKPFYKYMLMAVPLALGLMIDGYDIFHFNRVEGPFAGLGFRTDRLVRDLTLEARAGYAFDLRRWRHLYSLDYILEKESRFSIGGEYRHEVRHRPMVAILRPDVNPTFLALAAKIDPHDYYFEEGFQLRTGFRPWRRLRFNLKYNDFIQESLDKNTDYSFWGGNREARSNPAIDDGRLRSMVGELIWDSRPVMNNKGRERRLPILPYTIVRITGEYAEPDFIDNDFDFSRLTVSLFRRQRTLGLGTTELFLFGGTSEGGLPRQRLFSAGYSGEVIAQRVSFKTPGEKSCIGSRVAVIYADHDFGRRLWKKSGLPLIKDLPLSMSVHGGVFWTDFSGLCSDIEQIEVSNKASKPYSEIGFSLGGLLPLNMRLDFTWQLSDHPGDGFTVSVSSGF